MTKILACLALASMTVPAGAAKPAALDSAAFCQLMLTPGAAQTQHLSDVVLVQIGEHLNRNKNIGQFSYMQDMRDVMVELISAGTITQAQAEILFAERVLGTYSRIFLKYTIAELLERGFKNDDIVQFVLHFEDAYNSSKQVEFAVAVGRRMLLTINEETGIHSAQGLKNFVAMAQAFGISAGTYSEFLQLWVHIRSAHPGTIVHFILSNIKNAGHALRERLDEAAAIPAPAIAPRKFSWWGRIARPVDGSSAINTVTQEWLNPDSIPDSIRHPFAGFNPNSVLYKTFLDRFWAQTDTDLNQYLDAIEQRPPFTREFIVGQQLPELTFARLEQFAQTSVYQKLSPELCARGNQILADFKRLQVLATDLQTRWPESSKRAAGPTLEYHSGASTQFEQSLAFNWTNSPGFKTQREVFDIMLKSFNLINSRFGGKLGTEDFISIASKVIDFSFTDGRLEQGLGGLTALQRISRDFDLNARKIEEIYVILDRHSIWLNGSYCTARDVPLFTAYFQPRAFGRNTAQDEADEEELKGVLTEIRELLARHAIYFRDLYAVHERISQPEIPKPVQFLPKEDW